MEIHPSGVEAQRKRPKDTPFRQQTMKAYKPVPTVLSAVITFAVLGVVFVVIGSVVYSYSQDIVEVSKRYDDVGDCKDTNWEDGTKECTVTLEIDEELKKPVYFYYELHNYYQNHRRYVKSKSQQQLAGEKLSKDELDECDPIITYKDLGFPDKIPAGYDEDDVAYPCGLIAKTVFNDTYTLTRPSGGTVTIDSTDIAWESDDEKFETIKDETPWTDVEDPHFIVWMRTAGLPDFRKLWGKIDEDLEKGTYTVTVFSNYDVSDFDGEKHVVISTTNKFGGKNNFLGVAYIVVGALSICLAILFLVRGYFCKRPHDLHA